MSDIGTAYVQIEPTAKGISGKIEKEMGGVGTSSGNSFNKGFGSVLSGTTKLMASAVAAGGAALASAGVGFVKASGDVAAYGDNIDKMSQKMGLSAEAYQEWDAVMQHSGTSMEAMKASMKTLANAAQTNSKAFEELGLTQEQIAGMSQEQLFEATISALQNVEDTTTRTYLAGKTLGRGATELGALLNTSAEETQAMRDRVRELGGVMSDDAVKAAAAFQDQLQDMQTAFQGLSRNLISEFLPQITQVMSGLTDIFSGDTENGIGKISEGIKGIADSIMQALPEALSVASGILSALGDAILQNIPLLTSVGIPIIQELAESIISAIPSAMPVISELINSLLNMIISLAPQLISAGLDIILQLANGITLALPTLTPTLTNVLLEIVTMLTDPGMLTSLIQAGIDMLLALGKGLMEALPMIISQLPIIIENLCSAFTTALPLLIDAGIQLTNMIVQNLPAIMAALNEAAPQIVESLAYALIAAGDILLQSAPALIETLVNGLIMGGAMVINAGINIVKYVVSGLKQAANFVIEEGSNLIKKLKEKILEVGKNLIGAGSELITKIKEGLKNAEGNLFQKGIEITNTLKNKIIEKVKNFIDVGKKIVESIKEGLAKAWESVVEWFKEKIEKLKKSIGSLKDLISGDSKDSDTSSESVMSSAINAVRNTAASEYASGYTAANYQPAQSNNEILDLLKNTLPDIASGKTITLKFDVDGGRLFRLIQIEESRNTELVGV